MSQSLSRRSFLKCAGSGAVSLAAALLTGVSAAAAQPRVMGQPALLDGKAAVELLGYAPASGLGGVLVYLSVENLSARTLPVGRSRLRSGRSRRCPDCKAPSGSRHPGCGGSLRPPAGCGPRDSPPRGRPTRRRCLGLYAQPRRRARRDAPLLLRCPGGLGGAGAELSPRLCRRTAGGVRGAPGRRRRPPRTGAGDACGSRKRCGFINGFARR